MMGIYDTGYDGVGMRLSKEVKHFHNYLSNYSTKH